MIHTNSAWTAPLITRVKQFITNRDATFVKFAKCLNKDILVS